jgi:hypothetical protein
VFHSYQSLPTGAGLCPSPAVDRGNGTSTPTGEWESGGTCIVRPVGGSAVAERAGRPKKECVRNGCWLRIFKNGCRLVTPKLIKWQHVDVNMLKCLNWQDFDKATCSLETEMKPAKKYWGYWWIPPTVLPVTSHLRWVNCWLRPWKHSHIQEVHLLVQVSTGWNHHSNSIDVCNLCF